MKRIDREDVSVKAKKRVKTKTWFYRYLKESEFGKMLLNVTTEFIKDSFNTQGIVDSNDDLDMRAIDFIRSKDDEPYGEDVDILEDYKEVKKRIKQVYGQIHFRFAMTDEGCKMMRTRFTKRYYGVCTHPNCNVCTSSVVSC